MPAVGGPQPPHFHRFHLLLRTLRAAGAVRLQLHRGHLAPGLLGPAGGADPQLGLGGGGPTPLPGPHPGRHRREAGQENGDLYPAGGAV